MALNDVLGQTDAIERVRSHIERGRMPHAYLFVGESGIGKHLTAINLAKTLNCLGVSFFSQGLDACDQCPSCMKIDKGNHPDIFQVKPEKGTISVDKIREVEAFLSLKAFEGKWKVAIVDDAHTLTSSAANAFLKTLEEPPSGSLIILISYKTEMLLETIRSRCQRIQFVPMSPTVLESLLKSKGIENAKTISGLSGGRVGLAMSQTLIEERDKAFNTFKSLLEPASKTTWNSMEEIEQWIDWMLLFFRDMAILKYTNQADYVINNDIISEFKRFSQLISGDFLSEFTAELLKIKGLLNFNLNKQLTYLYLGAYLKSALHK